MIRRIKTGLLLVAVSLSIFVAQGMQSSFNKRLQNDCDLFVKNSNFYDLKQVLYSHKQSIDCVRWFAQYADQGHCWALYMLTRDCFIRNGRGDLEVADEPLIFALECIMKFIIRFDQDVACWQLFGQSMPVELRMGLRTKIRDWFVPMIRADRKNEFDEALVRVKKWFQKFPEGEHLGLGILDEFHDNKEIIPDQLLVSPDMSGDYKKESLSKQILLKLPSPVCVRSMMWEKPNTLSYVQVKEDWLVACADVGNKARFQQTRKEVLDSLLQDFTETAHARGFIESLSNEQSGWMATVSSYVSVAAGYAGPVFGAVFKVFLSAPNQQ